MPMTQTCTVALVALPSDNEINYGANRTLFVKGQDSICWGGKTSAATFIRIERISLASILLLFMWLGTKMRHKYVSPTLWSKKISKDGASSTAFTVTSKSLRLRCSANCNSLRTGHELYLSYGMKLEVDIQ